MTDSPSIAMELPRFDRTAFAEGHIATRIGKGHIGGKAHGLVRAHRILQRAFPEGGLGGVVVSIPRFCVLTTDVFDRFMQANDLAELAFSDTTDLRKAHAFQRADFPAELVGDLRAIVDSTKEPLAVRSSSLLEDALQRPFAGVYETKMTPNNQHDPSERFRKLIEAIKFVYATTFFSNARGYIRATEHDPHDEKMAVVIQEVVGRRHHDRFYPELSGVARSYNYYPIRRLRPEDGVANLALGLGKTIVDGGVSWTYCPQRPRMPAPFASARELMRQTQTRFWAVNMGKPPAFDATRETEYLIEPDLAAADYDGSLRGLASTYVADSDRIVPGMGPDGPRVLDFAPLLDLEQLPLNRIIRTVLQACEDDYGEAVEIEFAMTMPSERDSYPPRFGLVQVRPMVVPDEQVEVSESAFIAPGTLVASPKVLGNGLVENVHDVVYVRPEAFDPKHSRVIAKALEPINMRLLSEGRPYVLIGFGRWGSSDPWLGIPVAWGQIAGAKAIVESTLPGMVVEPSQGAHFFHNICAFRVAYFTVGQHGHEGRIDWSALDDLPALHEEPFIRHVRFDDSVRIRVDGRTGRGVIERAGAAAPDSSADRTAKLT